MNNKEPYNSLLKRIDLLKEIEALTSQIEKLEDALLIIAETNEYTQNLVNDALYEVEYYKREVGF